MGAVGPEAAALLYAARWGRAKHGAAHLPARDGAAGAATLASAAISPEYEPPQLRSFRRSPAHYLWAGLIARIYEVFPLPCPICGGQMRIIAFITHSAEIRQILNHIGVDSEPPHLSPTREPPPWEDCDAQWGEDAQALPDWNLAALPAQTTRSISASVDESIGQGSKRRFSFAAGGGLRARQTDSHV